MIAEARGQIGPHWDTRLIRRFMMAFGPINALMDFSIFAVMLRAFHAGPTFFVQDFS